MKIYKKIKSWIRNNLLDDNGYEIEFTTIDPKKDKVNGIERFNSRLTSELSFVKMTEVVNSIKHPEDIYQNRNWYGIEYLGDYLSATGSDIPKLVKLYDKDTLAVKTILVVSNRFYIEWIKACADSVWHEHEKILRDSMGQEVNIGTMENTFVKVMDDPYEDQIRHF